MAWIYKGSKSIGAVCIGVALAVPALSAALADLLSRIGALKAQIAANVTLITTLPDPAAIASSIAAAAAEAVAKIAEIVASIPAPLISANVSLGADVAALLGLKASLETLVAQLGGALSGGSVHVWSVDSTNASLAADASAALSGGVPGAVVPSARVRGVLILSEDPGAFTALSTLIAI